MQPRSAGSTARREQSSSATRPRAGRVWAIFDWDEQGWQSFVSDPDVPPLLAVAGQKGKLQAPELVGSFDA